MWPLDTMRVAPDVAITAELLFGVPAYARVSSANSRTQTARIGAPSRLRPQARETEPQPYP